MRLRQQGTATYPIPLFLVLSADHVTGATGKSPTVTVSKNGAAFVPADGAVSEIGNGWYALAGNAGDRDTLGALLVHVTGAACDPYDVEYTVVPFDPFANLDGPDVRAALGMASADLDTQLGAIPDATEIEAAATAALTTFGAATGGDVSGAETAILAAIGAISNITADDVLDEEVEGGLTLRQVQRVLLAFAAGKASGGGTTTIRYRDVADGRDRIALTVDSSGNRTASVLDVTP